MEVVGIVFGCMASSSLFGIGGVTVTIDMKKLLGVQLVALSGVFQLTEIHKLIQPRELLLALRVDSGGAAL